MTTQRRSPAATILTTLIVLILLVLLANHFNRASSRYAFMGDSITQQWPFPRVDDGIFGQTTAQILARFPGQIVNHGYTRVYILAGTNDMWLNQDSAAAVANISRMVDIAEAAHVEPILAEIPPMFNDGGKHLPEVKALNAGIIALAHRRGLKLVDYYDALIDHPTELVGGVHMKRRSYLRMEWALLRVSNPF